MANANVTIKQAGFKPPTIYLTKPDIRGTEYGEWRAIETDYDGEIEVSKWKDGTEQFTMFFQNELSFLAWAGEYT